jgi:hypothetical protein
LRLRHLPALLVGLVASSVLASAPPAGAEGEPPTPVVTTVTPTGGTLHGSFTVTVDVDLAGAAGLTATATFGTQYHVSRWLPSRTISAQDCPSTCHLSWDVDTTSWGQAFHSSTAQVLVDWTTPDNVTGRTGWVGYYDAPVESSFIGALQRDGDDPMATPYSPNVFTTGGTVVAASTETREPDELVDVRLYTDASTEAGGTLVRQASTTWGADRDADGRYTARAHLDTSTLPEGRYQLYLRPHNSVGQWGLSSGGTLLVRHRPAVVIDAASPTLQGVGESTYVGASINRPVAFTWSGLRVSVDDGAPQVLTNLHWNAPVDTTKPVTTGAPLPVKLAAGTHTITTELLDTNGNRIGQPGSSTVRVVAFTETATVPPLVLGQPSSVLFKGSAPSGLTYQSCYFGLYEGGRMTVGGGVCKPGATSYNQSVTWTPQTVGAGKVEFATTTVQGPASSMRTIPVTVYARRSASLSAGSSSAYGTRLTATVNVRDVKSAAGSPLAAPGVAVTLQRKAAGSTTWVSLGTAKTDAYGKALIPFTNSVTARLRAVVASSVPGRTLLTAERAVTSVSTVSWSSLPTATTYGAVTYAAVYAKPYEKGASIRVQARRIGGAWATVGSATVSSSGYVKAGFRLWSRATWEVRVVRLGTATHATAYSTVRRITVR